MSVVHLHARLVVVLVHLVAIVANGQQFESMRYGLLPNCLLADSPPRTAVSSRRLSTVFFILPKSLRRCAAVALMPHVVDGHRAVVHP